VLADPQQLPARVEIAVPAAARAALSCLEASGCTDLNVVGNAADMESADAARASRGAAAPAACATRPLPHSNSGAAKATPYQAAVGAPKETSNAMCHPARSKVSNLVPRNAGVPVSSGGAVLAINVKQLTVEAQVCLLVLASVMLVLGLARPLLPLEWRNILSVSRQLTCPG
jgi:hypothetical protein